MLEAKRLRERIAADVDALNDAHDDNLPGVLLAAARIQRDVANLIDHNVSVGNLDKLLDSPAPAGRPVIKRDPEEGGRYE